jgi:hypothetical protein
MISALYQLFSLPMPMELNGIPKNLKVRFFSLTLYKVLVQIVVPY